MKTSAFKKKAIFDQKIPFFDRKLWFSTKIGNFLSNSWKKLIFSWKCQFSPLKIEISHKTSVFFHILQVSVSYLQCKTVGSADTVATNTIESTDNTLTNEEIVEWQRKMETKISPETNRIYGDILRNNFQKGTTQTDHVKGIVWIWIPEKCLKNSINKLNFFYLFYFPIANR